MSNPWESAILSELERKYPEGFMSYDDLADYWQVSKRTLYLWVEQGRVPSPYYFGKFARWRYEQIARLGLEIGEPGTFVRSESVNSLSGSIGAKVKKQKQSKRARQKRYAERKKASRPDRGGKGAGK